MKNNDDLIRIYQSQLEANGIPPDVAERAAKILRDDGARLRSPKKQAFIEKVWAQVVKL